MRLILKRLFLLTQLFLSISCTKAPEKLGYVIDISQELAQLKKDLSPNYDKKDLIKLPSTDKVASEISIGNNNPFSSGASVEKMILNDDFRLTGILSTKKELLAFVSYKNNSGVLNS